MSLHLTIPGPPASKGRPRFNRRGIAYTPKQTRIAEAFIKALFVAKYPDHAPLTGPLDVDIVATFGIPRSASKAKAREMKGQRIRPTKKPDCDNIAKLCDALNGLAFVDDSQIVDLHILKQYDDTARTEITIYREGEEP